MCDSRRPENGADSGWNPKPYRVLLEDETGDRITVRVEAAIGKRDAYQQARFRQPEYVPLAAEEVVS